MRNHHDRVAQRDAKQRDEADHRAERQHAAGGKHREHATHHREGHVGEHEQNVAQASRD